MEILFHPKKETTNQTNQDELLYKQLCDPSTRVKLIKIRDHFASFSLIFNFEKQIDDILYKALTKQSDITDFQDVYIVFPTQKTLHIHKMLHNHVIIEEANNPKQWSGFNIEIQQRLQYIDLRKFLNYLWCDMLLNYTNGGSKVCKQKLEKYVKCVLTDLNCDSHCEFSMLENVINHVKSKYMNDLEMFISSTINSFIFNTDLDQMFIRFIEWRLVLGAVPFLAQPVVDNLTLKRIKQLNSCFKMQSLNELLTLQNTIPPMEEVAVILKGNEVECWHLPSGAKLDLAGKCTVRIENKEVCLGSQGESLFYSELKVMHLSEKHYECQKPKRYILIESAKEDSKFQNDKKSQDDGVSPLFASLTKAQTTLFDENNPLSNFSKFREKTTNLQNTISQASSDLVIIEAKLASFLDDVSPEKHVTVVDEMIKRGLEGYMKTIQPKLEQWDAKLRDHLNNFRMQAIKQLASLPKDLYGYQERVAEINLNNTIEIEDFVEELSTTNVTNSMKAPNISHLEELEKSEIDLKHMQTKLNQYFDLAAKFMVYVKDAQRIISNLRINDSVKDLQVKALIEQKKEIVKLATKFRKLCDGRVEKFREHIATLKHEIDSYVKFQTQTAAKTKQHFLNIRDTLITHSGEWVNQSTSRNDKELVRLRALQKSFLKQFNSTASVLDLNADMNVEKIKVDGTVRQAELKCKIDDNTLILYREELKFVWKGVMNNLVSIQETVTKNGVQLYNIDEEHTLQKHILPFFKIIFNKHFFMTRKGLEELARIYGVNLTIEMTVKKHLKLSSETEIPTIVKKPDSFEGDNTGVLLENS